MPLNHPNWPELAAQPLTETQTHSRTLTTAVCCQYELYCQSWLLAAVDGCLWWRPAWFSHRSFYCSASQLVQSSCKNSFISCSSIKHQHLPMWQPCTWGCDHSLWSLVSGNTHNYKTVSTKEVMNFCFSAGLLQNNLCWDMDDPTRKWWFWWDLDLALFNCPMSFCFYHLMLWCFNKARFWCSPALQ